jgi:hypothetical protein
VQDVLDVPNEVAAELAGVGDGVLDSLRDRLRVSLLLRGNRLTLEGEEAHVAEARAVVDELVELVEGGHQIGPDTVGAVLAALDQAADIRDVFEDVVWRHRGKKIAPKTVTQKRYVDAIRGCTVTFGIGPAGTGKTYLAMALAVAALQDKQVGRLILTRPAVEAGERLGFLPGDMLAKVDPYLRSLSCVTRSSSGQSARRSSSAQTMRVCVHTSPSACHCASCWQAAIPYAQGWVSAQARIWELVARVMFDHAFMCTGSSQVNARMHVAATNLQGLKARQRIAQGKRDEVRAALVNGPTNHPSPFEGYKVRELAARPLSINRSKVQNQGRLFIGQFGGPAPSHRAFGTMLFVSLPIEKGEIGTSGELSSCDSEDAQKIANEILRIPEISTLAKSRRDHRPPSEIAARILSRLDTKPDFSLASWPKASDANSGESCDVKKVRNNKKSVTENQDSFARVRQCRSCCLA